MIKDELKVDIIMILGVGGGINFWVEKSGEGIVDYLIYKI